MFQHGVGFILVRFFLPLSEGGISVYAVAVVAIAIGWDLLSAMTECHLYIMYWLIG